MALNGVSGVTESYSAAYSSTKSMTVKADENSIEISYSSSEMAAATYTRSDIGAAGKIESKSKVDTATIEKLKKEAEERTASLRSLVEKMLLKQAGTSNMAGNLASLYRSLEVPDDVREQAQKDIAEDGYWGIEQTSDRIVSFAKALAGDDADTADAMLEAIKKGFEQAGKEWGEDLPDISQKTMNSTLTKMDEWIASLKKDTEETTEAIEAGEIAEGKVTDTEKTE